jgi:CBS domain-containing protein
MSENNVSCLVVVEEENLAGILTDKDMLRGVAIEDTDFRRIHVGEFMTSPVEVAPPQTTVLSAGEIMETKGIKRLPIVDDHTLVGLVTQTDITRGLVSISPLTSVSGIMTNDVATVDTTATVAQAAQAMSAGGISCVVAIHRQTIAGIVTEKDMLRRVVALHKDPATTKIADIMSFPVVTISPAFSVLSAGKKLDQMHLHHVVVTDGNRVCGIVTQTDIMQAVRAELQRLEQQRRTLASELDSLTRYIMRDVARLRNLVSDAAGIPDNPTNEVQLARPGRPGAPPEAIESQAADPSGRD